MNEFALIIGAIFGALVAMVGFALGISATKPRNVR